jgi:D-amino-acid dehydrogenase
MVVPSHVVPLAAPGMVGLGLRWMWRRDSPFYVRPRLSRSLFGWGVRFWRSATRDHVARSAPLLRDLHLAGRAGFEEWAAAWGDDFGLTKNGLLMLCRTAHGLADEARDAERARGLGLPAEVLGPEEAARLEPNLRLDVVGAVYYPRDCHLDPGRLMAVLRREAEAAGVRVRWRTPVVGWRRAGGRIEAVRTPADEFVLSAGAWSDSVLRDLRVRLPMQAGKGYSLTLPAPRRQPRVCALLSEARAAVTPLGASLRVGGTLELTGLDERIDRVRVRGIVEAVTRYLPDFSPGDFASLPAWAGLRPCSPDGLPYLGRLARYANLTAATGHAMMGVSLAPVTGRLVAEIVSGDNPSLEIGPLRPDRFDTR